MVDTRFFENVKNKPPIIAGGLMCEKFFENNWKFIENNEMIKNYDFYENSIKYIKPICKKLELKSTFEGLIDNKEICIKRIITYFLNVQNELARLGYNFD